MRASLLFCLVLVCCAPTEGEDPSLEPAAITSRALTVDGPLLRDELGRTVILRGFNAGGRAKMPPFLPFEAEPGDEAARAAEYFARLPTLGANLVRLTFSWEALAPTRGTIDAAYLAQYRMLLDAADAEGLSVIVDFHQDVFASPFCGDGFPLWAIGDDIPHGDPHYDCGVPGWSLPYFDPDSEVNQAFDRLWNNTDGLQDDLVAMWRVMASEFADHPAVAGFEIINEPSGGSIPSAEFEAEVLPAFFARVGAAIQEEAPGAVVFGGGGAGDALGEPNDLAQPDLPDYVYAPHYYEAAIFLGIETVDHERIGEEIGVTLEPAERWDVPVILGEFGAPNSNAAKGEYLDRVFDLLDQHHAHGALWEASQSDTFWNDEDFSVFDGAGTEAEWASDVVRAQPRAVAGSLDVFAWDLDRWLFTATVSAATDEVSEFWVPLRHLGDDPSIEVTGARWNLLEDGTLLVQAPAGTSYEVVVGP
ncbi:MAG: glycoside hydrolase family 5 protein [Proteobacteria bacterium]|nr:glycoside hydrolase family 5 protein [Pseudomonadota bacterium]